MSEVDLHFSQLKDVFQTKFCYKSVNNILIILTRLMQSTEHRKLLNQFHWSEVANLVKIGTQLLTKNDYTAEELEFVAHIFRFLRNSCGGSAENQNYVLTSEDIFEFSKKPLECLIRKNSAEEIAILKICIQLFGNILLCNDSSKSIVWDLFYKNNIFKDLLNFKDLTVVEYTMMVLYNCISEENSKYLLNTKDGHAIIIAATNSLTNNFTDWGMLFMEYLLKKKEFFEYCYHDLPLENRLLTLDIIIEHIKCSEREENVVIPVDSLEYIKNLFLSHVKDIAQLSNINNTDMQPSEFVKMISLLCSASICNVYVSYMLSCRDLLEKCIETLKCIHLLGKQSSNAFSSIANKIPPSASFNEQMAGHPLYGFKKDLIRLIGNLCYCTKENQDLVRKLDGIPLILDCCKIDAKNPYIMQWCILAIRNIMEKNLENQAVLAGITTTGEIADTSFLKELGIQISVHNGKLTAQ